MAEPVNIVLFKSKDCAPCKPVARHLARIVEMSGNAKLTIIDSEAHHEIASQYNVHSVPHVLSNGKVILTGAQASSLFGANFGNEETTSSFFGNEQGDLFTFLFNKLIEANVDAEKSQTDRWRKASILSIAERTLSLEDVDNFTRPSIGDTVHIGHLQSIVTSIFAQNPASKHYLYKSGYVSGKFGSTQGWLLKARPEIMAKPYLGDRFREFLKGLKLIYGGRNPYSTNVASNVEFHYLDSKHAKLQIEGSAYAANNTEIGQDVCCFLAGEIAGLAEPILGEITAVHETRCEGKGDSYCEFLISLDDETEHYNLEQYNRTEFFSETDRLRFDLSLANITKNMYDSAVLNRRIIRPLVGDFIHISVVQQIILAMKFADPFNSALLAYAGQNYGQVLEDVSVINRIMQRRALETKFPLEFEQACKVLDYYLNSPGQIHSRIQADVSVDIIDDESATFRVWESAASSGIDLSELKASPLFEDSPDLEQTGKLDDFMAGFINGRLNLLVEDMVIVKEEKCQAMGQKHNYCEFHVELD